MTKKDQKVEENGERLVDGGRSRIWSGKEARRNLASREVQR